MLLLAPAEIVREDLDDIVGVPVDYTEGGEPKQWKLPGASEDEDEEMEIDEGMLSDNEEQKPMDISPESKPAQIPSSPAPVEEDSPQK